LKAPPARFAETKFRDALLVALLIACPIMRLGNLTMIEIGQHLLKLKGRYELRFQGFEMKARKVDLQAQLDRSEVSSGVAFHPKYADLYRNKMSEVADLVAIEIRVKKR
jgi:hypothetical protein